jgi:hypothetical protein
LSNGSAFCSEICEVSYRRPLPPPDLERDPEHEGAAALSRSSQASSGPVVCLCRVTLVVN